MRTTALNDYTYMVLSQNDELNKDVGNVLDNVFGLRKVQYDLANKKPLNRKPVDIALVEKNYYNDGTFQKWSDEKGAETKLILIVDELVRNLPANQDSRVLSVVSRATLRNQLLVS
jgi:hypothetical protein